MRKTLVHEIIHGIINKCVDEDSILNLEEFLWQAFTETQKSKIFAYLPKHKVKRGPETA